MNKVERNCRTTGTSQEQVNGDEVAALDRHLWFCKRAIIAVVEESATQVSNWMASYSL